MFGFDYGELGLLGRKFFDGKGVVDINCAENVINSFVSAGIEEGMLLWWITGDLVF